MISIIYLCYNIGQGVLVSNTRHIKSKLEKKGNEGYTIMIERYSTSMEKIGVDRLTKYICFYTLWFERRLNTSKKKCSQRMTDFDPNHFLIGHRPYSLFYTRGIGREIDTYNVYQTRYL